MTDFPILALDAQLRALAPVVSVSIGDPADPKTWRVQFDLSATPDQVTAANAALAAFTWGPADQARVQQLAALDDLFNAKIAVGAPVAGGYHVGLDVGTRTDFIGMASTAVAVLGGAGLPWPDGYTQGWITVENVRIPLATPAEGLALAAQVGPYYSSLVQNWRTLKDELLSAADPLSVDLTQGWP